MTQSRYIPTIPCMSSGDNTQDSRRKEEFPLTSPTIFANAGKEGTVALMARERICELYWYPLYAFTRRYGKGKEDAQDIVQSFFENLLSGPAFDNYNPQTGRLRSYLLGALKNHIGTWNRKEARQVSAIDIDVDSAEVRLDLEPGAASPDLEYERSWAISLITQGRDLLRQSYVDEGKAELFDLLYPFMDKRPSSERRKEVEGKLNKSPVAIRMDVSRMRERRRNIYRGVVANTTSPENIDDEIAYLISLFANNEK